MTETRENAPVRSQFITRSVGPRPICIYAALDFSVIINLDSSKYSRQLSATAIYEINRGYRWKKRKDTEQPERMFKRVFQESLAEQRATRSEYANMIYSPCLRVTDRDYFRDRQVNNVDFLLLEVTVDKHTWKTCVLYSVTWYILFKIYEYAGYFFQQLMYITRRMVTECLRDAFYEGTI